MQEGVFLALPFWSFKKMYRTNVVPSHPTSLRLFY
jgi:hypothetical protein